ncbi:1214_t:CDS:2, partial [Scutellospora calospora]
MTKYRCKVCKRTFSTPNGLIQHVNAMHQGKSIIPSIQQIPQQSQHSQGPQEISIPEHDEDLWGTPIMRVSESLIFSTTYVQNLVEMEDIVVFEKENISEDLNRDQEITENTSDKESLVNFKSNDFDPEDLQGATLTIQALLQRPDINDNIVLKGILKKNDNSERVFGEPYERNWWLETEKTLPLLNYLLSIILYSDATTFDGFGKTSGHPIFLTLGNLPNWVRNSPNSKVLLGFLPNIKNTEIKTTEAFRNTQHKIYHKCLQIILHPLLEKSNTLYFGIRGQPVTFAARISFFISDMLEADEVTATYKAARCNMPCHTCMVLQNDLNQMNLELEKMLPRTPENMQQVKRKEIIPTVNKIIHRKTEGFGKILWDLNLDEIESKVTLLKKLKNLLHPKLVEGLSQIISALDTFLDTSLQDSERDFQGKEWFSNVSVTPAKDQKESADGLWYGKPYELALVHWYDILSQEPELYSCSQLYYSEEYDIISIGCIIQEVHIVPRFDKEN